MPISPIVLQRRHAELGRIRLGDQRPVGDSGRTRPNKLDRFRFTSHSERYTRDLATLYGGEAKAWDNHGVPSWEVYSTAQTIPVIAVKGGLTQWMETWSGGGCVHRCDGITNQLTGEACDPKDTQHLDAKPTTRLSVMLPELEAIGVWRMESHGWNSAAEIPAVAELATFVGDLVPAHLHLVERRAIKDGKTSRFVVPVLDLQIGTARLKEIVAAKVSGGELPAAVTAQVAGKVEAQIAAPLGDTTYDAYTDLVEQASTREDLVAIWDEAKSLNLVGTASPATPARGAFFEAFQAKSTQLNGQSPPTSALEPDGVVDAELVDDADAVWQRLLAAGGARGMNLADVSDGYAEFSQGQVAGEASAAQLQAYLEHVQSVAA